MSACPAAHHLMDFAAGRLPPQDADAVEAHIDGCGECLALVSHIALEATLPPEQTPAPGGRFELLRCLGEGGMGVVYEALDRDGGARVAVKTLRDLSPRAAGASPSPPGAPQRGERLLRFKHEFRALQGVAHRNLVRLGDLVEQDGAWLFSMELVHGCDLLTYVTTHPAQLVPALLQLAQGLGALHRAGLVHRDIKPSNVLVQTEGPDAGRVVILDFGLISAGEHGAHDLTGSRIVGTVAYMAPEQAAAAPGGPAADWYAVGVILYEALAGRLPFVGSALQVMRDKTLGPAPPLPAHDPAGQPIPLALAALCLALLERDPAARADEAAVLRALAPAGAPAPVRADPEERDLFLGRAAERARLAEALREVRTNQAPAIALISGESGIGKSALARQLLAGLVGRDGRDGLSRGAAADASGPAAHVVLTGRCHEREAIPFNAVDGVIDALSRYLRGLSPAAQGALLPRRAALLSQLFPVLGSVPAFSTAPPQPEISDRQERCALAFTALRDLLSRLCERVAPVLFIDDLQWADGDSLQLLCELLRPPDAPALLLLATLRSDGEAAVAPLLSIGVATHRVPLGPLDDDDAQALAGRLLAAGADQAARIARAAGGHPLFLRELALLESRAGGEPDAAPAGLDLRAAILRRVAALPALEQQALRLCSLACQPLPEPLLARALADADLGADVSACGPSLAALCAARLLRATSARQVGRALEPYHDRVREAVLHALDERAAAAGHRRLAEVLRADGRADPVSMAHHLRGAGDLDGAADHLAQAAAQAEAALAFSRAADLYQRALSLRAPRTPDEALLLYGGMGEALAAAGRPIPASAALQRAAQAAPPERALRLRAQAADQLLEGYSFDLGLPLLRQVLSAVGLPGPARSRIAALLRLLGLRLRLRLRGVGFRQRSEEEIRGRDPAALLRLDICWGAATGLFAIDLISRADYYTRHLLLALRAGDARRVARGLLFEGLLRVARPQPRAQRGGQRYLAQAEALAEQVGDAWILAQARTVRAMAILCEGRFAAALGCFEEAQERLLCCGSAASWELDGARTLSLYALANLGQIAEMSRRIGRLRQEGRDRGHGMLLSGTVLGPAILAWLAAADVEGGRRVLDQCAALHQAGTSAVGLQLSLARALLELYAGDAAAAWQQLSAHAGGLTVRSVAYLRFLFLEARARCLIALWGRPRRLLPRTLQSLQALGEGPAAAAQLLEAAALAAQGDRGAALSALREAVRRLDQAGMALHAAAARVRLGQWLDSGEGRALAQVGTAYLVSQGVRQPARMVDLYLPAP